MSGHTPGPWDVVNAADVFTRLGARNAAGIEADSSDGWYVADCSPGGSFVDGALVEMHWAERKANARLIAAAPLLLEKAQNLRAAQRDYMADRGNEAKGKRVAEAAAELDAAITHATGGAE